MNPYKILDIDASAEKRDVVQAAALALRQRHFSAKEVAVAQKELLHPVSKAAHGFLQFLDLKSFVKPINFECPKRPPLSDLKRLSVFDEAT